MPSQHENSQGSTLIASGNEVPKGYQQITDLHAAVGLTVAAGAKIAIIQCRAKSVSWRDDGTDPTASIGMQLFIGDTLEYTGDLTKIKFIENAASATLDVSYYT